MKIKYNLLHKEKDTKARYGTLETNYGTFETPMFMPVGTQATVKTLSPEEWQQFEEIRQGIAATGAALATLGPFGFSGTTAATTSSSSRFLPWVARNVANWWKNAPEPAKQWFRQALRAEAKTFDKAILANDVSGLQTILSNPSLIRAMAQPSSQIWKSLMKPI